MSTSGPDATLTLRAGADRLAWRRVQLTVVAGPDEGVCVDGEQKLVRIGTEPGNTLRLADETVSRFHVELSSAPQGIRVRDLDSTNGTWLAGNVRVHDVVVPPRSVLYIGRTQVRIDALAKRSTPELSDSDRFGDMIGSSPEMRALFALLERVAPSDETVLITGETGTGKEVCARAIIAASPRATRPVVVVDCGAISPGVIERELFGHVRGAYTGAVADAPGAFEQANGGTLFLDEIGELPLELQPKLLRAVEHRTVRRVGDAAERAVDIRIIAATNRALEQEVNRGTFRSDLYYRLSVVQVHIPPLRERLADIERLARAISADLGLDPTALSSDVLEQLRRHRWPGNVRELSNAVRRLAFGDQTLKVAAAAPSAQQSSVDLSLPLSQAKQLAADRFERAYLSALMQRADGKVAHAARLAQTDRGYLSRLLKKHDLRSG